MFAQATTLNRFALGYLEQLVADIDDAQLAGQHFSGQNHPAWVLGHLAVVADYGLSLVGQPARNPKAWRVLFGPGSKPVADRSQYPAKGELVTAVAAGYQSLAEQASAADRAALAVPHTFPPLLAALPTRADMIAHLLTTHFALHLSQISQWRRQAGKDPLF